LGGVVVRDVFVDPWFYIPDAMPYVETRINVIVEPDSIGSVNTDETSAISSSGFGVPPPQRAAWIYWHDPETNRTRRYMPLRYSYKFVIRCRRYLNVSYVYGGVYHSVYARVPITFDVMIDRIAANGFGVDATIYWWDSKDTEGLKVSVVGTPLTGFPFEIEKNKYNAYTVILWMIGS